MGKIGIITYHAAYNYGSVLQAYALFSKLRSLGKDIQIINYRPYSQKRYYCLYRTRCGIKPFIKDILQVGNHFDRRRRAKRFEEFIRDYFELTKEYNSISDFEKGISDFDQIISGSDQVWNKRSWELRFVDWKYMSPYLLKGFPGVKISYASSVGSMTDEEVERILPDIRRFSHVSFREKTVSERYYKLSGYSADVVVDPTFLLDHTDWIKEFNIKKYEGKDIVLYYSLAGYKENYRRKKYLSEFAKKRGCELWSITPECSHVFSGDEGAEKRDFGPIEFLNALYTAKYVITDSYHGTILSVNFQKPFYSICGSGGSEYRKTDVLDRIGLENRVIKSCEELPEKNDEAIDYELVNKRVEIMKADSVDYLKNAVGE